MRILKRIFEYPDTARALSSLSMTRVNVRSHYECVYSETFASRYCVPHFLRFLFLLVSREPSSYVLSETLYALEGSETPLNNVAAVMGTFVYAFSVNTLDGAVQMASGALSALLYSSYAALPRKSRKFPWLPPRGYVLSSVFALISVVDLIVKTVSSLSLMIPLRPCGALGASLRCFAILFFLVSSRVVLLEPGSSENA